MKARYGHGPSPGKVVHLCCACAVARSSLRNNVKPRRWPTRRGRTAMATRLSGWSGRERMPNILICDDERSICEMLDITLRREGYKVETVNSGEAGKKKLDSFLYDVVITDIKMPN